MRFKVLLKLFALTLGLSPVYSYSQNFTGVGGTGWREVAIPVAQAPRVTSQAAGTYQQRPAVLIQIDDATGLANSPLPQVVKDNLLRDGLGDESIYVDRDVANAIADGSASVKFASYIKPDSRTTYNSTEGTEGTGRMQAQRVTAQGLFCDSGWRDYTLSRDVGLPAIGESKKFAQGAELTLDAKLTGSANIKIAFEYKKSDWSLCIPYAVRFKQAAAKGRLDLNESRLALKAAVTTTVAEYKTRVAELYENGGFAMIGPIPVWYTYSVPLDIGYKVIFHAAATAEYSSQMTGFVNFDYVCRKGSCTGSSDTSTVRFTSGMPNWGMQADATFDPFAVVGIEGKLYPVGPDFELASAGMGLKFSTPLMAFAYYGNACGDSNKDGQNELVSTYFVDLQARVSLQASWSLLSGKKVAYVSLGGWAGRKINGALHNVLNEENNHTPLWNRSLYYSDSGSPSIFSPVLRQLAGTWNGSAYEHALRVSMRPCVPFNTNYFVDIKDPAGTITTVNVPNRTATTEQKFYSSSPTLALMATRTRDDDGRVFSNSSTVAPQLGADGSGPVSGGGTFAYVSMTRTSPGNSSDIATIKIKNVGAGSITGVSYSCSGLSWHGYGTGPSVIASGATVSFQCQPAMSGAYTAPIFTVSGSATNSPFKPAL